MSTTNSQCKLIFFDALYANLEAERALRATCSQLFTHLPLVDFYFDDPRLAPVIIFALMIVTAPLCFFYAASTAQNFLAIEMKKLANLFGLSQSLAAVTLLAFAASAPDIIAALSNNKHSESTTIITSIGMGVYFFGMTIIVGVVSMASRKNFSVPKEPLLKEIVFSLVLIMTVVVFGIVGEVGFLSIAWLFILLLSYLFVSLYIEKVTKAKEFERSLNAVSRSIMELKQSLPLETSQEFPVMKNESEKGDATDKGQAFIEIREERSEKDIVTQNESMTSEERAIAEISRSLHTPSQLFVAQRFRFGDLTLLPLHIMHLVTIPSAENPFCKGYARAVPWFTGTFFTFIIFEIVDSNTTLQLALSSVITVVFLLINHFWSQSTVFKVGRSAIVVLVALAWIQFFISIVIDYLAFLSFYYSANDVILRSFLLASGTSVGELVGSHALATVGAEIMALLSVYSGSFFNMIIVLIINILTNMKEKKKLFDVFGVHGRAKRGDKGFSTESIYVIGLSALSVGLLVAHLIFFSFNRFKSSAVFGGLLVAVYAVVFILTISVGIS